MRLVVIGLAIDACYRSHKSDFSKSDWYLRQFTLLMNWTFKSPALLSKLAIVFPNLTFKSLIGPWDNSLINYMLSSTLYLDPNAVMTAGLSSYKSKFIYYFKIAYYWGGLSSNRGPMKKLWYWHPKTRSNFVQSSIFLLLHLRFFRWHDEY